MKSSSTQKKVTTENEAGDFFSEEKKYWSSFQNMLMQTPVAIAIFRGINYKVELANDMGLAIIVKDRSFIGKALFEVMPELLHPIKDIFDNIMQTGIPFTDNEMELILFRNGKNETGWFNVNYQPIREDDKTISGILASANEVTDQVLARKKIEDSEKRYNMMLMKSPFGFAVLKGESLVITLANDTLKEIWGKGKDIEGKPLFDLLPELKDSVFPSLMADVYTTGVPFQGNDLLAPLLRNGKLEDAYFNLVYQPYLEADETISGVTVIAYEVTAQVMVKKAFEAQRAAEQKASKLVEESNNRYFSMLMESPFAFSMMKGKDMVITLANDLIKDFWGKGKDVEGKTLLQILPELIDQPFPEMIEKVYTTGIPVYANEILGKVSYNGQLKHKYFNVVFQPYYDADNSISGVTQIAYDVTEMILARKKIEESDRRYNMMLMNSPFGFAILKGKNMLITLANESIKTFWGKGNDIEGKPLFDVIPELKNSAFPSMIDNVYSTGVSFSGEELLAPILRNGKQEDVYFNFVYQPYMEVDETISGVTVIAYEVTAQVMVKKALEAQRAAEQKASKLMEETNKHYYSMLMDSPFAFCVMKGKSMTVILANDLIKEFWGKGNMVEGKTILQVLPELKDQSIPAMLDNVFTTGIPVYANEILVRLLHQDTMKDRYFNIVYQPDHDADGTISGVITIAYDVTEMVLSRKKIEESDKRYNMMLMNSPFTFAVLKGKDLVIDLANDQIKEVWGRGNDIEGKSLLEIMPELKDSGFPDLLEKVRATGIPFHGVEVQSPKNLHGHVREEYFNFVFQPYLEADQTISGITIIGNDVTEQVLAKRKIQESEEHFRQLAELMPAKISIADAAGNVSYFNKHWLTFSGYTFEELRDFGYHQIMHPDELEAFQQRLQNAAETSTDSVMEMRFKNKEGAYIWHLNIASPVKDKNGKHTMWVGVTTEMQHQKEQREELEHAVLERTAALSVANEELKKMNKELEAFAYVSSHDLQEPLRKIRTMAGRIMEKENENLSDSGKYYFHLMQNAAERMQTLIQDLLAFSRLSMAERKFENTPLNIIIEDVKNEFKETIREKNAIIEVKEICSVKIIPFQFRQLMHNLIGNAIKFSNPTIPPHIKISSININSSNIKVANLAANTAYCHISIADNGIGFEKKFAEKIFEVFQKLHAKDEYAGTGIGLAIVKKIVENHNGNITVISELGKGTTFNIYIPA